MQADEFSSILTDGEVASFLSLKIPVESSRKVAFSADSQLLLSDFISLCGSQSTHHGAITVPQLASDDMIKLGKLAQLFLEGAKELYTPIRSPPEY